MNGPEGGEGSDQHADSDHERANLTVTPHQPHGCHQGPGTTQDLHRYPGVGAREHELHPVARCNGGPEGAASRLAGGRHGGAPRPQGEEGLDDSSTTVLGLGLRHTRAFPLVGFQAWVWSFVPALLLGCDRVWLVGERPPGRSSW